MMLLARENSIKLGVFISVLSIVLFVGQLIFIEFNIYIKYFSGSFNLIVSILDLILLLYFFFYLRTYKISMSLITVMVYIGVILILPLVRVNLYSNELLIIIINGLLILTIIILRVSWNIQLLEIKINDDSADYIRLIGWVSVLYTIVYTIRTIPLFFTNVIIGGKLLFHIQSLIGAITVFTIILFFLKEKKILRSEIISNDQLNEIE